MELKIVLTCRREDDIQKQCSNFLAVDQGKANANLTRFISNKCKEISKEKTWPDNLENHVQTVPRLLLRELEGHSYGPLWSSKNSKKLA